jgi:hypothetical protein
VHTVRDKRSASRPASTTNATWAQAIANSLDDVGDEY